MMKDYKLQILNAAFVASGVAIQAKGILYRLRHDKGRDVQKSEDYPLDTLPTMKMPSVVDGGIPVDMSETPYTGSEDYWLGRNALTDLVINVPEQGLLLINDITMNVSLQKEIVKTALVGRKGTIKEYISDGDYQINMNVGLVAINDRGEIIDRYPERAMAQLRKILETGEDLEVNSAFLDVFGISRIVVTGFSAQQMTHSNRQLISITAISDDDYMIKCTDY